MDPSAAMTRAIEAATEYNAAEDTDERNRLADEVREAACDLGEWFGNGGFAPADLVDKASELAQLGWSKTAAFVVERAALALITGGEVR